jgi:hypothetical protein
MPTRYGSNPVTTAILVIADIAALILILDPPRDDWPVDREIGRGAC